MKQIFTVILCVAIFSIVKSFSPFLAIMFVILVALHNKDKN